ncbi:MAG: 50S ribosomal protein L11 methyltransferase [Bacteroidales bacterium]|nr:50S ribosomal protein L11 methyltransferase [Bacteroidales bacterium]
MNDYYEVRFDLTPCFEDATDLLASQLADAGYESFVPDSKGVSAYVPAASYSAEAIEEIIDNFPIKVEIDWHAKLVPGQDWNQEWEKNYFQPIVVGDQCVIHSSFHTDYPAVEYDITIDPKMAFGTGHHSTTSLIIEQLLAMDLRDTTVIDMGTGTGILAILAAMRGATTVTGIEIDECAYVNARDNVKLNHHPEILIIHGDASALSHLKAADLLIANINRNIITADLGYYAAALKEGGKMLLSGFYQADCPIVEEAAKQAGLTVVNQFVKADNWAAISLVKN